MSWRPNVPYNDLPLLPPSVDVETKRVLKATTAARAALAALDQAARLLPDPEVLLVAATVLESQASSEIENIVTTADALFRYVDADKPKDQATKEALRYRSALREGVTALALRPLTVGTAERVCSRIKNLEMSVRQLPATRIANPGSGRIVYAPPEGAGVILDLLGNWERFLHAEDELDPLVRMAIAHYQFEAIHPFHDGNGRTGRILNILMLIDAQLIDQPILYLSRFINRHRADYYRLLLDVTRNEAWESWILYLLEAVRATATSTLVTIDAIRIVQRDFQERARAATTGGRNADFLAVLFEQPYCRISTVVERCGVSRPTATAWLSALSAAGLLMDHRVGRDRLFVNQRFLDVLLLDDEELAVLNS